MQTHSVRSCAHQHRRNMLAIIISSFVLTLLLTVLLTVPLLAQDETPPTDEGAPASDLITTTTGAGTGVDNPLSPLAQRLAELGGYPCPGEILTCVKLIVPYDHAQADEGRTLTVVFGVKPAVEESRGMLVVAVGGPGGAGIGDGMAYLRGNRFGEALSNQLDLLFFDVRGVGLSHPLTCPAAVDNYSDATKFDDPESPAGEAAMLTAARTFAEACVDEMNEPDLLPYLATKYAVEDLALFLDSLGQQQIYLYGESYGTQFAQTFAAAHPERIAGLMLDGVVDLSLTGEQFYRTYVKVIHDNLLAILKECNKDQDCAADAGGDALALLDRVIATVDEAPITVDFPLPVGSTAERTLGKQELRAALAAPHELVLHALLAAAREDYLPLLRLYYANQGIDPLLNRPLYRPDLSDVAPSMVISPPVTSEFNDAGYYNVDCADYQFFSGTPEERGRAYMAAGDKLEKEFPVYSQRFYADLPCVYWPTVGPSERPEPFTGGRYPTFIINGTLDRQTPIDNGYAIFPRLQNGYMITQRTGGHVNFQDGGCPAQLLSDFLLNRILPTARQFVCPGSYLGTSYTPQLKAKVIDYQEPAALIQALVKAIASSPQLALLNQESMIYGCTYGGAMSVSQGGMGLYLSFADCAEVEGFVLNGFGSLVTDAEGRSRSALHATITGAGEGYFSYTKEGESGIESLLGEYQGKPLVLIP